MSHSPDVPSDRSHNLAPASTGTELCIRSYCAKDRQEVLRLDRHGHLTDVMNLLDPRTDFDHIEEIYLKRPQDHFWVAEIKGDVIASIAMREDDRQIAHVHRLRVETAWKMWHGGEVVSVLIRKATHHARQHDCLKLVLHTPVNDEQVIALLHQMGFECARGRELGDRHSLEVYLNPYVRLDWSMSGNEGCAE